MQFRLILILPLFLFACQSWGKFWDSATTVAEILPTVTITNLKANGDLWTNQLFGTSTNNPTKIEISIAGAAYASVTGIASWRYTIPFSANLKSGKKYSLSIRVTSQSGKVSIALTQNFIRRQNNDINGDGYQDVVFAAPNYLTATGAVYVYYGNATGFTNSSVLVAPTRITGGGTFRSFGSAVVIADVNGDGYGDLCVGGEQYLSYQGGMWVFYGSASGISSQAVGAPSHLQGAGEYFGGALAAGDINGDGYQDIIVGARERSTSAGAFYVYLGTAGGLSGGPAASKFGAGAERLGTSIATGDFNSDGFADVAAGSPTPAGNPGTVSIFVGTGGGLNTTAVATITGEVIGERFGEHTTTGDYNNDGHIDLIVSSTQRDAGAGANQGVAYLLPGSATGFSSFITNVNTQVNVKGEAAADGFSRFAQIADINNDGFADVILNSNINTSGVLYIMMGSASSFATTNASGISRRIIGKTASDRFGASYAFKDINGDGFLDLAAGAFGRNSGAGANQGAGYIFLTSGAALTATSSNSAFEFTGEAGNDQLGLIGN